MATASEIAAVGVIGAGQMGSGIAQLAAAGGCAVLLLDADPTALSRAVVSISASLRRLAAKGQLSQVSKSVLSTSQSTLPELVRGFPAFSLTSPGLASSPGRVRGLNKADKVRLRRAGSQGRGSCDRGRRGERRCQEEAIRGAG